MKIGIDVRMIQPFPTGIGNYRENLIKALAKLESSHDLILVGNPFCKAGPCRTFFARIWSPANSIWQHLLLPFELKKLNLDLFWTTPWGATLFLPCPHALTIYDLLYQRHPEFASPKARLYDLFLARLIAQRAKFVFATSDFVKKDVVEFLGVDEKKVFNIQGAAGEEYQVIEDQEFKEQVLKKYGVSKPFFVYLGNLRPHKNLLKLLEAFARIIKARPFRKDGPCELIIIGDVDAKGRTRDSKRLLSQIDHLKLQDRIILTGRIDSDREVAAILNEAVALVHPSLHEGFGLTVLEAMGCGCPVIAAKTSSIPEVAGEAAVYVDPSDVDDIARGIIRALDAKDTLEYPKLRKTALNQAKKFSWEKTARRVLEVFDAYRN